MTTDWDARESLGYILSRTYLSYKKAALKASIPYGITPEQYGILHRLSLKEAISQKELAELHVRDQTSVSKIIEKLERKNLVIRTVDPRDRRAVLLYLTQEGKQLIQQLNVVMEQIDKQAATSLSDSELANALGTINIIFRNLHD